VGVLFRVGVCVYVCAFTRSHVCALMRWCVVACGCCMRSEGHPGLYIQGAGDDEEAWAHGLQPSLFWTHGEFLADAEAGACVQLCEQLIEKHRALTSGERYQIDGTTIVLQTCALDAEDLSKYRACVLDFSSKKHTDLPPLLASTSISRAHAALLVHRFPVGTSQKSMRVARNMGAILELCDACLRPAQEDHDERPARLVLYSRDSLGAPLCIAYALLAVHCDSEGEHTPLELNLLACVLSLCVPSFHALERVMHCRVLWNSVCASW
jgi:Rit1 N-terminal domain